jgi:thioesterase domain-containing protein/acyl carrier protein
VYKTGDLARYRDDGEIEFLGRRDHQVKLRGFRIELGEIETALARQPDVTAAVAVAREDAPGDVRLVAYVVATEGTPETATELRQALTEILPSYMVPSVIVLLDDLPLTPNGKVDRKALPEPQQQRPGATSSLVHPRTKLEEQLVDIWEAELGISPIGVTDDFFMLGVTSLVAARLLARIERQLGSSLPLGALFRAPTVESLARLLEHDTEESRWTSLVPIQPNGSRPPLFCVHGGAGTVLHLQPLARQLGSDQPFYGLQARGLYGGVGPLTTVEQMAVHYLDELRMVQPHGPYNLAGYCFGSIVAFDMAQRLVEAGETVELLAVFNGPSPTWLHKYGSISRQPSRLARRPPSPPPRSMPTRIAGVLVSPHKQLRWARHLAWRLRHNTLDRLRTRLNLRFDRPIPENLRGDYFLAIAAQAELAYEPTTYDGSMVVFFGDGLYDDPDLGWLGLAKSIRTIAVPGEHTNNRMLMAEPWIGVVSDHLQELLAKTPVSPAHP